MSESESTGWVHVTPEQVRAFRKVHRVSRARMAQALGVNAASVQNWEYGRPAQVATQERIASLIAAGPSALKPLRKPPSLWDASGPSDPARLEATGAIVVALLARGSVETQDELVTLIRTVRSALAGPGGAATAGAARAP